MHCNSHYLTGVRDLSYAQAALRLASEGHQWLHFVTLTSCSRCNVKQSMSQENVVQQRLFQKVNEVKSRSALIVTSDVVTKTKFVEILSRWGYTSTVISTADKAIPELNSKSLIPDVIIADVLLREKSGVEFIRELRVTNTRIPIIAISGCSDFSQVALNAGASTFVTKNCSVMDLRRVLFSITAE